MQTKKVSTLQRKRGGGVGNEPPFKVAKDEGITLHEIKDSEGKPVTEYNLNSIFNFFEIAGAMHEYLKDALYDASGLYSLMNWVNKDGTFTYNNLESHYAYRNVYNNNNLEKIKVKENKDKKELIIGYDATPKGSKHKYEYMGTFIKSITTKKGGRLIFKCEIFKNSTDDNILVLFKWGERIKLTNPEYKTVLDNMFIFIVDKISTYRNSNILLFGFSMGANIAQHIALRFIDNKDILKNDDKIAIANYMKDNIYIVSLGAGGTMTSEKMATFNANFTGKFLSIAIAGGFRDSPIAADNKLLTYDKRVKESKVKEIEKELSKRDIEKKKQLTNYNTIYHHINTNILRDLPVEGDNKDKEYADKKTKTETVKSLIINMDNYFNEAHLPKYKLGRLYDYNGLQSVSFGDVSAPYDYQISSLHDYKNYRMCIEMLFTGNTTADIP